MLLLQIQSNCWELKCTQYLRVQLQYICLAAAWCAALQLLWMTLCPSAAAARHLPRRQRKVRKSSVLGFLLERSEIWVAGGGNNGSTIFIGVVLGLFGWDWANFLCACSLGLWKQEQIRNTLGRTCWMCENRNSPFRRETERSESISHQYQIPCWVNNEDSILFVLPSGIFCYNLENQKGNILTAKSVTTVSYASECLLAHDTITVYHSLIWKLNLYFAPWKCLFFFFLLSVSAHCFLFLIKLQIRFVLAPLRF